MIGLLLEIYRFYLLVVGLGAAFSIKASRALMAIVFTVAVYILAAAALNYIAGGQWVEALK